MKTRFFGIVATLSLPLVTAVPSVGVAQVCVDQQGPNITCSAVTPFTAPPTAFTAPRTSWGEPRAVDLDAIMRSMNGNPEAIEKLKRSGYGGLIFDGADPQRTSVPTEALSCGTPSGSGTLSNSNPPPNHFYDVLLVAGPGSFTANTGANHPDGAGLNVIFPSPSTSDISFHLHNNNTNELDPPGGMACAFNPPDTAAEPNNVGIEQEWTRTPLPGLSLTYRQEIVTFGTNADDSGIRMTLCTANSAGSTTTAKMGFRWQIDYMNSGDDGPGFAPVTCNPFTIGAEQFTEHEFAPAEIKDFYRTQNNSGAPIFGNFTNTTAITGFPGTDTPDRLVYGRWGSLSGSGWNYVATEGANADGDSAVLYYFGYAPADAIDVLPGATACRSVVIFTKGQNQDCGNFDPGTGIDATVTVCPGDNATIGATANDDCTANPLVTLISSSAGAPTCTGNPCSVNFPTTGSYSYTWEAEDDVGNTTTCTSQVVVRPADDPACNQPPSCDAGGPYTSQCTDVDITATVSDPDMDTVTYTWSSSNPDVSVTPDNGSVNAGTTPTALPPTVATLNGDACGDSATLTLAVDDGQVQSTCTTTVTFDDDIAPMVSVALVPVTPLPASSAATASSAVCPSSAFVQVVCDGPTDNCDPNPSVAVKFVLVSYDVPTPGQCLAQTTEVAVACGDIVELHLLAPACASGPASAGTATGANSAGQVVLTAESITLVATATDRCANETVVSVAAECPLVGSTGSCTDPCGQPFRDTTATSRGREEVRATIAPIQQGMIRKR